MSSKMMRIKTITPLPMYISQLLFRGIEGTTPGVPAKDLR